MRKYLLTLGAFVSSFIINFANADTQLITDFETIDKGTDSYYDESDKSKSIEIYNHDDWLSFWLKHRSFSLPNLPSPVVTEPLPIVNFDEYYVLVVLDQSRGSGGYALVIKTIEIDSMYGNRPIKIVTESRQPGSMVEVSTVVTRPYHIIKIKK